MLKKLIIIKLYRKIKIKTPASLIYSSEILFFLEKLIIKLLTSLLVGKRFS